MAPAATAVSRLSLRRTSSNPAAPSTIAAAIKSRTGNVNGIGPKLAMEVVRKLNVDALSYETEKVSDVPTGTFTTPAKMMSPFSVRANCEEERRVPLMVTEADAPPMKGPVSVNSPVYVWLKSFVHVPVALVNPLDEL